MTEEIKTEEAVQTDEQPENIIRNHVLGSMGVGLIPMPLVDLVALTGVQLNLLRKLAKKYNVPFSQDKGKNVLAALLGSGLPVSISGAVASLIKSIPLIGQTTGAITMSVLGGATTYAVGKVFEQHFASGGTFLNFDPEAVKDYYAKMFKEGEKVAEELKKKEDQKVK
ncbi:MAG: DUF697 domain-containing protein [Desulfobacterales bacterium]|nr:DUF697 domain-containing protein [Desulfobacterales bacterium]